MNDTIEELEKRVRFALERHQAACKAVEDTEERLEIERTKLILATETFDWVYSDHEWEWKSAWDLCSSESNESKIAVVMETWEGVWRAHIIRFPQSDMPSKGGFTSLTCAQYWVMEQLKPYLPSSESEPSEQ